MSLKSLADKVVLQIGEAINPSLSDTSAISFPGLPHGRSLTPFLSMSERLGDVVTFHADTGRPSLPVSRGHALDLTPIPSSQITLWRPSP